MHLYPPNCFGQIERPDLLGSDSIFENLTMVKLKLTNKPVPSTSFQATPEQELRLAPVSRLFPNKSIPPGYKPAPGTLPPNNHQSEGKQKLT